MMVSIFVVLGEAPAPGWKQAWTLAIALGGLGVASLAALSIFFVQKRKRRRQAGSLASNIGATDALLDVSSTERPQQQVEGAVRGDAAAGPPGVGVGR